MDIMTQRIKIQIFPNDQALFQLAATDFRARVLKVLNNNPFFSLALSGGNTPKSFFDVLTSQDRDIINFPWNKIKFFFGDERYVPASSSQSNYHMANQYLFSKLPIDPKNIFFIPTDLTDPNEAALCYEQTIRSELVCKNHVPCFDLIYLGLGDDGHTASLMPSSKSVEHYLKDPKHERLVESEYIKNLKMYRVTMTPRVINHASNIIFLVTGSDKAPAVAEVLEGKEDPLRYPAQLIQSLDGETIWYLDSFAADKLKKKSSYEY